MNCMNYYEYECNYENDYTTGEVKPIYGKVKKLRRFYWLKRGKRFCVHKIQEIIAYKVIMGYTNLIPKYWHPF